VVGVRTLINASLRYGSKEIIVGVASVASRKEVTLKTLHETCGTPISLRKWCASCGTEADKTVKGWEQVPGSFLVLDEVDLAAIAPEADKTVVLESFMAIPSLESPYIERNYWLTPGAIDLGYWALHAAMKAEKVVGVGHSVLWGKESPCVVAALGGEGLLLKTLFYDEEIAAWDIAPVISPPAVVTAQRKLLTTTRVENPRLFKRPTRVTELLAAKMASKAKDPTLKTVKKALKTTGPKGKVTR